MVHREKKSHVKEEICTDWRGKAIYLVRIFFRVIIDVFRAASDSGGSLTEKRCKIIMLQRLNDHHLLIYQRSIR